MHHIYKSTFTLLAIVLVFIGSSVPLSADTEHRGQHSGPRDRLTDADRKALDDERQRFLQKTKDIRQRIYQKDLELKSELAKEKPDVKKATDIQSLISRLESEFDQERLIHFLNVRKIDPDFGRGYGGGHRMGDWMTGGGQHMGSGMGGGCPMMGGGHHMGPGMGGGGRMMGSGQHTGPGMMGGGHHMGPGMMGRGYGGGREWTRGTSGMGGPASETSRLQKPLNEEGARSIVDKHLASTRNPNLKMGKITEQEGAYEVDIVTKEGSLVDKVIVDKSNGWMRPAYE